MAVLKIKIGKQRKRAVILALAQKELSNCFFQKYQIDVAQGDFFPPFLEIGLWVEAVNISIREQKGLAFSSFYVPGRRWGWRANNRVLRIVCCCPETKKKKEKKSVSIDFVGRHKNSKPLPMGSSYLLLLFRL